MTILAIEDNHPLLEFQLQTQGHHVVQGYDWSYETIVDRLSEFDGVVIRSRVPIDQAFLNAGRHLKFIARVGSGMENIDVVLAKSLGIELISAPEGNCEAVGEHAVMLMLAMFNHLKRCQTEIAQGVWNREENRGETIQNKTITIIGYGHTGQALAKRLTGFEAQVLAYDILPNKTDSYAIQVDLDTVYATADVVSLHLPQTPDTQYWFNAQRLAQFKKPIYLINTSRGGCVNTADLVKGLTTGQVLGAGLDVLEYEKKSLQGLEIIPPDLQYLIQDDRVVLTPHVAGWTFLSHEKLAQTIVDKIAGLFPLTQ